MRFILYALFLFPFLSASYHADAYIIAGLNAQAPTGASIHLFGDAHIPSQTGKDQFEDLKSWFEKSNIPSIVLMESRPWESWDLDYFNVTMADVSILAYKHKNRIKKMKFIQADGRSLETVRTQLMSVSLQGKLLKTQFRVTDHIFNDLKQINHELKGSYGLDITKEAYFSAIEKHIDDLEWHMILNTTYKNRIAKIKQLRDMVKNKLEPCNSKMDITECFKNVLQSDLSVNWESSVFNACINIDTYIADAYFIKYLYEYKDSGYPLLFIIGQAHVIALKEALGEMQDCTIASEIGLTSHVAQTTQECIAIDIEPLLKVQAGQITLLQWLRSLIALLLSPFV